MTTKEFLHWPQTADVPSPWQQQQSDHPRTVRWWTILAFVLSLTSSMATKICWIRNMPPDHPGRLAAPVNPRRGGLASHQQSRMTTECAWLVLGSEKQNSKSCPIQNPLTPPVQDRWCFYNRGSLALVAVHGFKYFWLSLQSTFHHSITLLVHYRSCNSIQPWQGYTCHNRAAIQRSSTHWTSAIGPLIARQGTHGTVTLSCLAFPCQLPCLATKASAKCPSPCSTSLGHKPCNHTISGLGQSTRCYASSFAITEAITVVFSSTSDWYA